MRRVRITCRGSRPVGGPYGMSVFQMPDWQDIRVTVVNDDGSETELTCVDRVEWCAQAGTEVPIAKLHIIGPELDVEGSVALLTGKACYRCGRAAGAHLPSCPDARSTP